MRNKFCKNSHLRLMKICREIMPPVKNDRKEETFQRAFEQMINKKITVSIIPFTFLPNLKSYLSSSVSVIKNILRISAQPCTIKKKVFVPKVISCVRHCFL